MEYFLRGTDGVGIAMGYTRTHQSCWTDSERTIGARIHEPVYPKREGQRNQNMEMEGDEMSELNVTPGVWVSAHLMAASKELYEALVIAREYASEEIARRENAGINTSLDVGYLKQIDAALAKARGEGEA
jgi:hypothetical protein